MKKILAILATLRTLDLRSAKRLFAVLERKPIIEISQFGWATDRPQLVVSMISHRGSTTLMAQADDDAGNARCSMHARTLSNISGLSVIDRRAKATNEADRGNNGFKAMPRDAEPEVKLTRNLYGKFRFPSGLASA